MENFSSESLKSTDKNEIIIKCGLEEMTRAFFKDYEILWHDPNVNSQENQQYLLKLEKLCKIKTFTELKESEDYIRRAKTVCHVITSGTNGELLVKEIFSSQNVPHILTFCRNEEQHSAWAQNYEKVLCTKTKIEDVISQIQKNLLEWHKQTSSLKFDLPAFAPIFDDRDKSQMNHLHLYLKIIPKFNNRAQAKNDFVNLAKRIYPGQNSEDFIENFEQTYNEYNKEAILKWYTQPTFLHKMTNNCLRIATSHSIQYCRLALKDIERAIKEQYQTKSKHFSGLLYRGAYLSEEEWSVLKTNINREIEMHGFLSVSKMKSVAWKFMGIDPSKKVFITILVPKGPNEEEQGFAEVEEFSEFPKEKEVLFNVRSRFTILEAENELSKGEPFRHLVLLYGAQGLRQLVAEKNPTHQVSIEGIENISCSSCKAATEKMTEKFFFMSIVDLEKRVYSCQKCLDDDNALAPFICIPLTEIPSTRNLKGCCLFRNSSETQIPLYGYKCSQCGVKRKKRYFVCTDCGEKGKIWCEDCFGGTLSCIETRHSIISENYPFSFWCEKMSENELNHLKFQSDLVTKKDQIFPQAQMYVKTHEYEKAIEYYNLYIEKSGAKANIDKLATAFCNIGLAYSKQGEYKEALKYHLKYLETVKSFHEENHPSFAFAYSNIGLVYHKQGEFEKALEYSLKSLNLRKILYGENHLDTATSFHSLGLIYDSQGAYTTALEYYLKSLNIRKILYDENHPDNVTFENKIGLIYDNRGESTRAIEDFFKSLEVEKLLDGENLPDIATSYKNIARVYGEQGEYDKAVDYHLKSLKIDKSFYRESLPSLVNTYNNIGLVYDNQGESTRALECYFKSLEIEKLFYGESHPSIAISYNNIGLVYDKQGEYKKALEYYLKSLNIGKIVSGEDHPNVATTESNIGLVYYKQGEHKKALEYYLKSLNRRKKLFGEIHPHVAISYHNIAVVYDNQGEYKKALDSHLKSLEIYQSFYGGNNSYVEICYLNVGFTYEKQGEYKKALEYYSKSLDIRKVLDGENHFKTIDLRDKICKIVSIIQNKGFSGLLE